MGWQDYPMVINPTGKPKPPTDLPQDRIEEGKRRRKIEELLEEKRLENELDSYGEE